MELASRLSGFRRNQLRVGCRKTCQGTRGDCQRSLSRKNRAAQIAAAAQQGGEATVQLFEEKKSNFQFFPNCCNAVQKREKFCKKKTNNELLTFLCIFGLVNKRPLLGCKESVGSLPRWIKSYIGFFRALVPELVVARAKRSWTRS